MGEDMAVAKGRVLEKAEEGIVLGFLLALLGSYLGNIFVTASHFVLLVAYGAAAVWGWGGAGWAGRGSQAAGGPGAGMGGWSGSIRGSSWCLIGLVAMSALSVAANLEEVEGPWKVLKKLRYHVVWIIPLVLPWVRGIFLDLRWRGWLPWMLGAWYGSILLATASGLVGHVTGFNPLKLAGQPHVHQVSGIYGTVMTYAYSMQFSFLLLAVLLLNRNGILRHLSQGKRWIWGATLPTFLGAGAGLYFSQARGAVLGIVVGLVLLAILYRSRLVLGFMLIAGIVGGAVAYESRSRYFASLESESVRVSQWSTAIKTFARRPWLGVGYRQFEERCVELKQEMGLDYDWYRVEDDGRQVPIHFKGHAHNEYLEAFASTGVFGGVFYLGFCGFWCREVARSRVGRKIFLPVIGAFLVSSLVQNVFTDSEVLNFILAIYFASQIVLDWERQEGPPGEVARATSPPD